MQRKPMCKRQRKVSRLAVGMAILAIVSGVAMAARASDAGRLAGHTWIAESIRGGGVIDNVQSTLVFASDGRVTGSGGCNRLLATAMVAGDTLIFEGVGTTRKACAPALMDQEQKFLAALATTRTFRFEGPYLKFYDAGGIEQVRFTQQR
jgi:heat shock protein HslJ